MKSSLSSRLSEVAELTGKALKEYLSRYRDEDFPVLWEAMDYATAEGGKRIRPFLVLEFCRMFGGNDAAALPFACAVEAVHSYSLVHDDLPCMDNDLIRRGKPSCHAKFGEAAALLCGDALLTAAFEIVASAPGLHAEARLEGVRILAECSGAAGMVGGQQLDLIGEKEKLSYERLLKMNMLKTGALIRASCLLGCVAAGAGEKERAAAGLFADRLGLAFQLTDDLLDYGTEDDKTTYLTYLSLDEARKMAKSLLDEAAAAVADFDKDGILREFCGYIANRDK
ncbi:MAG TPA: polyprenyl synthetase family protein [Bacillota bacterium]|nr:polyprenyl synthetase family protein [Bacillota bacterium]